MESQPPSDQQSQPDLPPDSGDKPVIASEEILRGAREVLIRHADAVYRLCVTRNGKLILQK